MVIRVHGEAYEQIYDYKCKLISRTEKEAIFETKSNTKHIITIRPQYIGSTIGSCDFVDNRGRNTTICAFCFDGKYVALALFAENGKNIEINPCEY